MTEHLRSKRPFYDVISATRVRRAVVGGIAAAGIGATWMSASPAAADDEIFADVGAYAGWMWGEGGGFTWGIEGRVGGDFNQGSDLCREDPSPAAAATLRVQFVDSVRLRLALGGQLGFFMGPSSLLADFGIAYRWGEGGGVSAPVGLDLQVWAVNAFISGDMGLGGGYVGGGFRAPPPDRQLGCVAIGRPLHDERGRAELPSLHALEEQVALSELDRAIVHEWSERARMEWASVPAFLQLADQLHCAGAPEALVRRALAAADDELRHAVMAARVTARLGGAPVQLARVTRDTRPAARGAEALRRLAVESWIDGCLGEGTAAVAARREARGAEVEALAEVQHVIAADEGRHADLAWDVLAWAVREGGDDVRHAVDACRDAVPGEMRPDHGRPALDAFGVMGGDAHARVALEVTTASRQRLGAVLRG